MTEPMPSFTLYRCVNLATTCDYPFLAVNDDRSVLIAFGDYYLDVHWRIPRDLPDWLAHDFVATGQVFACDVAAVRQVIHAAFADKGTLLLVHFSRQMEPTGIEFSLASQKTAEGGADFEVEGRGSYRRFNRSPRWEWAATPAEQALLDVYYAFADELAQDFGSAVRTPSPIIARRSAAASQTLQ